MRSIRKQPFCWQEKSVNRIIREKYKQDKSKMGKMLLLYATITEIDSDFNGQDIKYYTKTIAIYSGLSKSFIPSGIRELEEMKIIKIIEEKEKGKFKGKKLIFTPEQSSKMVSKSVDGLSVNGCKEPSEHNNIYINNVNKDIRNTYTEESKRSRNQKNLIARETEFSILEENKKLLSDKRRHIQIIGIWLKAAAPKLTNKLQLQSFIKRNVRAAKLLEGYDNKRIFEVIKWLKENANFKITLETVTKYIDDDLKKLQNNDILVID